MRGVRLLAQERECAGGRPPYRPSTTCSESGEGIGSMLRRLSLRNFRTCVHTEMTLEPVTLLIGRNNSGKTNICQALRFLSAAASEDSLDEAARSVGLAPLELLTRYLPGEQVEIGIQARVPYGDAALDFDYRLAITVSDLGNQPGNVLNVGSEQLNVDIDGTTWSLIDRDGANATVLVETPALAAGEEVRVHVRDPQRRTMLTGVWGIEGNQLANAFKQYLESWRYHSISPTVMRSSRRVTYDPYLSDGATNLASVLYTLKSEDTRSFSRLIGLVQEIEPSIETFNFVSPRPDEVYMVVEDTEGNRYSPESLSDGTLSYIALCCVAMQGSFRMASRDVPPPGLVAFEDPERGLYVGHLRRLVDVLQEAGKTQQVLLTTHNPYLIDLFEQNPEQIRVVSRGGHALRDSTTVATPDPVKLQSLLESFSLGEMYYRELLQ